MKTSEAAALLRVSPNTLRAWERRFGYPMPRRSDGGHRRYVAADLEALRDALEDGLSIQSAIGKARSSISTGSGSLANALLAFNSDGADRAMESALAFGTVENAVETVLIPGTTSIHDSHGTNAATWVFAARWALGWMDRVQRMGGDTAPQHAVLIGEALGSVVTPERVTVRALELLLARSGVRVLSTPVDATERIGMIADSGLAPAMLLVAGSEVSNDTVGRWVFAASAILGRPPVVLYPQRQPKGRQVPLPTVSLAVTVASIHESLAQRGSSPDRADDGLRRVS
ncbi:MerR family transcriptional regulator [Paraconexibacter sp. AEG42_29]